MTSPSEQLRFLTETAGVHLTTDRVLFARGDDAREWLNGQVTNDVKELGPERAVYALAATVKGRVISDLWAIEHGGALAIVLPAAGFEAAFASFDKHVIMEDVELAPDPSLRVITVQGPRALELRQGTDDAVHHYEASRLETGGFDLWVPADRVTVTLDALDARARAIGGGLVDEPGWVHAHVARVVPRFGADFGPDSYPQEAGLKSRALSFSKGCYRGQEVIYMLENRGQLGRRLVSLEGPPGMRLEHGQPVEADGKRVGELTSIDVTPDRAEPTLALGYVKRAHAEVGSEVTVSGATYRVRAVAGLTDGSCPIVAR